MVEKLAVHNQQTQTDTEMKSEFQQQTDEFRPDPIATFDEFIQANPLSKEQGVMAV